MTLLQDDEDRQTPAELAAQIGDADRPSRPQPEHLRFQWNVPMGVKPHIPLWLSLLFAGLLAVLIFSSLLSR